MATRRQEQNAQRAADLKAQSERNSVNEDYSYINYKTGKKVEVKNSALQGKTSKGSEAGSPEAMAKAKSALEFNKRYNEDAEFRKRVQDGREGNFFKRLGNMVEDSLKMVGDAAVGIAPFAAMVAGGIGLTTALGGVGAGAAAGNSSTLTGVVGGAPNAAAPTAMTGTGVTGMGGVTAETIAGTTAATAAPAAASTAAPIGGQAAPGGVYSAGSGSVVPNATVAGGTTVGSGLSDIFGSSDTAATALDLVGLWGNYDGTKDSIEAIQKGFEMQNPFHPYREQYAQKLNALEEDPSKIADTPGYRFTKDQGLEALWDKQASVGHRFSGRAMEETTKYGSGLASQMYQSEMDRYAKLAGAYQPTTGGVTTGQDLSSLNQQDNFNTMDTITDIWKRYS